MKDTLKVSTQERKLLFKGILHIELIPWSCNNMFVYIVVSPLHIINFWKFYYSK